MTDTTTPKGRFMAMVVKAIALLDEAADSGLPSTQRAIRRQLEAEYGASQRAAHRAVSRAREVRAGQPMPEWGGVRPDAGRPRKAAVDESTSGSSQSSPPQE